MPSANLDLSHISLSLSLSQGLLSSLRIFQEKQSEFDFFVEVVFHWAWDFQSLRKETVLSFPPPSYKDMGCWPFRDLKRLRSWDLAVIIIMIIIIIEKIRIHRCPSESDTSFFLQRWSWYALIASCEYSSMWLGR